MGLDSDNTQGDHKFVVLVSGPTCTGKTTAIDHALANPNNNAMGCFIGREMRKRHPPEYFEGSMAMEKTEPEVQSIFLEVYWDFMISDKTFLICDGIPRLPSQVRFLHKVFQNTHMEAPRSLSVALIRCTLSDASRFDRMRQRGGSASEQALAAARFEKDVEMLKPVYEEVENVCLDWKLWEMSCEDTPGVVLFRLETILQTLKIEHGS